MYVEVGKWEDVIRVRRIMKEKGMKNTLGWRSAKFHGRVHTFYMGDKIHP